MNKQLTNFAGWRAGLGVLTAALALSVGCTAPTSPAGGSNPDGTAAPKVNRLVLSLTPPPGEYNDTRRVSGWDVPAARPMYETLIGVDRKTGKYMPELATEWKLEPNGESYRFKLQKGAQFNRGMGEFTAKDVAFTFEHFTDALPQPNAFAVWWKRTIKEVQIVNDYEVVFHFAQPDSTFIDNASNNGVPMWIMSKAGFEKDGPPGDNPAKPQVGSGPYDFGERIIGSYIRYKQDQGKHWRATPAFPEMEYRWVKEPSTRLAALLADEAHIAGLPNDMFDSAEKAGLMVLYSSVPGTRAWGQFVCCSRTDNGEYYRNHDGPLLNAKVRQALNVAIDRPALQKAFFPPKSEPLYVLNMYQAWPGWDTSWERRFPELYGFNQAKARQLLAEAGYNAANPLKMNIAIRPNQLLPNQADMSEAIAANWRAVGVDVSLLQQDIATQDTQIRAHAWTNHMFLDASATQQVLGWPNRASDFFAFSAKRGGASWFDKDTNALNEKLAREMREENWGPIMKDLGELFFTRHGNIPLFYIPAVAVYNPKVVAEYELPGSLVAVWTHTEFIKAAR